VALKAGQKNSSSRWIAQLTQWEIAQLTQWDAHDEMAVPAMWRSKTEELISRLRQLATR
jgi:hypothetical protein